jgi:hypothetical protein
MGISLEWENHLKEEWETRFKEDWDKISFTTTTSNNASGAGTFQSEKDQSEDFKRLVGIQLKRLEVKPGDIIIVQLTQKVPPEHLRKFLQQLRELIDVEVSISVTLARKSDIIAEPNTNNKKPHIFIVPYGVTIESKPKRLLRPKE